MNLLDVLEDFSLKGDPDADHKKVELYVLECNKEAMKYLRKNDLKTSLDLLRKAEKLLFNEYKQTRNEIIYRLIGITLNNLGCYYKKTNKLKVALNYLKKALEIEVYTLHDKLNIASTHLNICAILSSLTRHNEALKHAKIALELLQAERSRYLLETVSKEDNKNQGGEEASNKLGDKYKNIITTMIMAYYNYGAELEHIKDLNNSLKAMTSGYELANRELGPDHSLTINIKDGIQKLIERKKESQLKANKRDEYIAKIIEENQSIGLHNSRRPNFPVQDSSRKAKSVNRMSSKLTLDREKSKSLLKSRPGDEPSQREAYSSQNKQKLLPYLPRSNPNQRGQRPPLKARDYLQSITNNNQRLKTEYASANLPPIRTKQNDGNLSAFLPSENEDLLSPYKNENKKRGYLTREDDVMDTEIDTLDNQIYKLQNEILQIEEDDVDNIPKEKISSYKKVTPLRRNYKKSANNPGIDSNRQNALEIPSNNLDTDLSSPGKDSFYGNLKPKFSRESNTRSIERDIVRRNQRPNQSQLGAYKRTPDSLQIKDNYYTGDISNPEGFSNISSKKSNNYSRPLKGNRNDSIPETDKHLEESLLERKLKKQKDQSKEKILVYMQYFD